MPSRSLQPSEIADANGGAGGHNETSKTPAVGAAQLEAEFDKWAQKGWGAELELDNRFLMESAVKLLDLKPGVRVLDLSCGSGLATRMIADRLAGIKTRGRVIGVDISPRMLELARHASRDYPNVYFIRGSADSIPSPDESFYQVMCVESFYYYPEQGKALDEIYRVMTHQGRLYVVLRLYSDNPYADEFLSHLSIPVHVRSMTEYVAMLREHGFGEVQASRLPEPRSRRGGTAGMLRRGISLLAGRPTAWASTISERLRIAHKRDKAKSIGALLLTATKP